MNRLNLTVKNKGTHMVAIKDWNNDVPSPCEVVADCLADFEARLNDLIRHGGSLKNPSALKDVAASLGNLDCALQEASEQNWSLELKEAKA